MTPRPADPAASARRPRGSFAPTVLDGIQELVAQVDRGGTLRAVNRAWMTQAAAADGRPLLRQAVVGANYLEVCERAAAAGDEAAAAARRGIEEVLAGELPRFELEYSVAAPELLQWYRLFVTPLGARRHGAIVIHADITASKRTEEELATREEWQRLILETSSDLISTHSFDSSFLFVSAACRTLLGFEPAELLGRRVLDLIHPDDLDSASATLHRLQTSADVQTIVCRYRRKDGHHVWVEAIIHVLRSGSHSDVPFLAVSRDISARREVERRQRMLRDALERAAFEWATTFDAIRSPILILAPDGHVVRANEAARELSGRSLHGILGHSLAVVGQGEPWDEAAITVRRLLAGSRAAASEARDEESGHCWQIEASLAPSPERGGSKIILKLRDVTDMVRLQESLRRSEVMATLGAVVAGVAHEVRNPLAGMSSLLETFESRFGERPEYQRYLPRMRAELERIRELMEVLLSHGRPPLPRLAPTLLEKTIDEALSLSRPAARWRHVVLEAELGGEWPPIAIDRERLVLALKNVVDNAVEHAPPESAVRVVARRARLDGGDWLQLRVEDSGPGFASADLPHVFEPFYSRRPGGTGLGLAIVAQLVESQGGRVRAETRAGGGAAVEILLPLGGDQLA